MTDHILVRALLSCYVIATASLIHGLLGCAIILAQMRGVADVALHMRILAVACIVLGLLAVLMLEGYGTVWQSILRLALWGYAAGLCIGIVSGWCLLRLAVLMDYSTMLLTSDFFSMKRIMLPCAITVPMLLFGKSVVWCLGKCKSRLNRDANLS